MHRILLALVAAAAAAYPAVRRDHVTIGGSGVTAITGIAVDKEGFVYQAGTTSWAGFPTTAGPLSVFRGPARSGPGPVVGDVFIRKLSPDLRTVIYSVLIGGSGEETSSAIAVDESGSVCVTGYTESSDFPVTSGYAPPPDASRGFVDVFVFKLNSSGTALVFSRVLGGKGRDTAGGIAVAPDGRIVVAGATTSRDFPTTPNALQTTAIVEWSDTYFFGGESSAFVARLWPDGATDYVTYLTGIGGARGTDVAVDTLGDIYVTGFAGPFFPTVAGTLAPHATSGGFVSKIDRATGNLVYSTYLPGVSFSDVGGEGMLRIRIDRKGHAYVAGPATIGFPTTPGAFQSDVGGLPYERYASRDAFLLELDEFGQSLVFSTLFGAGGDEIVAAVALTGDTITIAGISSSVSTLATDYGLARCNLSSTYAIPGFELYTPFVARFDHSGRLITAFDFGNCNNEKIGGIAQATSGLLVAGPYGQWSASYVSNIDMEAGVPVQIAAVTDAASFQVGPCAPLELVTFFGKGLGPKDGVTAVPAGGAFPTSLGGTEVLAGGTPMTLLYAGDDQVNAIVPAGVTGWVQFQVRRNGSSLSAPLQTWSVRAAPGLFTADRSGQGPGAILNQDGSLNSPANPARRGSAISLFGTGGGVTAPLIGDGQLAAGATRLELGVTARIGLMIGKVEYAGSAPGLVNGVMQVNVRIPENAPTGPYVPVQIHSQSSYRSQSGVTVAIE